MGVESIQFPKFLRVLEPNPSEKDFLDALERQHEAHLAERRSRGETRLRLQWLTKWKFFLRRWPTFLNSVQLSSFSPQGRDQMGYHWLLGELIHDPREIGDLEIGEERRRALLPAYFTDALILEYEIQKSKGGTGGDELRNNITTARPYMGKGFYTLERTAVRIESNRAARRASEEEPKRRTRRG